MRSTKMSMEPLANGWLERKTVDCPPITAFTYSRRHGWPKQYEEHVRDCEYCQRTIGIGYRIAHPDLKSLRQYKFHNFNRRAIDFHLHYDKCKSCSTMAWMIGLLGEAAAIADMGLMVLLPKIPLEPALAGQQNRQRNLSPQQSESVRSDGSGVFAIAKRSSTHMVISLHRVPQTAAAAEIFIEGLSKPIKCELHAGGGQVKLPLKELRRVNAEMGFVRLIMAEEDHNA
jgi:hypothetical protein